MSTDWTTNKNKEFGKEELYLKISNTFASIGLIDIDDNNSVDKVRKTFYNLYKRHKLCEGDGNWNLFDRYISSNEYTDNKLDDLVVLNSAINVNKNNNNILYSKDNSQVSIDNRKNLIENEIKKLSNNGLCNEVTLTGFFPHLDVVSDVEVRTISGLVPCWELGEETLYGIITYSDSCHTDDDFNKCLEPVPTFTNEQYERNTLRDMPEPTSTYSWEITKNKNQLKISEETGLNSNILKCSMKGEANLTEAEIRLKYSE